MKMRGKMVDGSPVTFESIDLGLVYPKSGPPSVAGSYITDFVGEGFHVRSEIMNIWRDDLSPEHLLYFYRRALEQSGVDTATVEREGRWIAGWGKDRCDVEWEKIWPTVTRFDEPRRGFGPFEVKGIFLDYCGEEMLVGEAMIEAGVARLKDMLVEQAIVRNGEIWFRSPTIVLTKIWQAMMTAKKRGG